MAKMVSDDEREELESTPLDASVYRESTLEPLTDPMRIMQKAVADEQSRRERAEYAKQARERADRKAKAEAEREQLAQMKREGNELVAREAEAKLEVELRASYPAMTDEAWKALWPKVRDAHYMEQHAATQQAERESAVYSNVGSRY